MIVLIKRFLLFFVVIFSTFVFSQENTDNEEFLKGKTFQLVSGINLTTKNDIAFDNLIQSGGVNIKQIGSYNSLKIYLKAESVAVSVVQNGTGNQLELEREANSIKQKVVQEGQNNSIKDFSIYTNNNVNIELIQQGNNQSILNYGSNSISENMKVVQSGNGAAVIIINRK
ncbi:MAG: adenylate cyclase [Flavobacterium sp.]|jgi:adenylate cyclase